MSTALTTPPATGIVSKTGIVLATMDEIWRFAETVINSGMAPKGITNPSAATITIQMGMELGLPPMASLQNIAPINGRPSIWGDAMLGVVRSTGELEEFSEWFENNGTKLARTPSEFTDTVMAVCRVKRRGYEAVETSFSVADAKRAKLWGKQGPWTEYTSRMLKMRARAFNLRDQFGDALRGLYSAEEQQDMPNEMRDVTPRENTAPPKVITGGTTTPAAAAEPEKKTRKSAAKDAPVEAAAEALPTRKVMYAGIKEAAAAAELSPASAEAAFKAAGLLDKPIAETTDDELHAMYVARFEILKSAASAEKQEPTTRQVLAIYQNHQVTNSKPEDAKKWTHSKLRYSLDGEEEIREAGTYSTTIGKLLDSLEGGEAILITFKTTDKGETMEGLELAPNAGGAE